MCVQTTAMAAAAAIMAWIALAPSRRTLKPACAAKWCRASTMPRVALGVWSMGLPLKFVAFSRPKRRALLGNRFPGRSQGQGRGGRWNANET